MNWVVVDTSYLLELFRVPGDYEEEAHQRVSAKFAELIQSGGRLYVPVPVIFELANHVADVADGHVRYELARKLKKTVETSLEENSPWIILPTMSERILLDLVDTLTLCNAFAEEFAVQSIGLTDISLISISKHVAEKAGRQVPRANVFIWTRDAALKAHEPNAEPDAFV